MYTYAVLFVIFICVTEHPENVWLERAAALRWRSTSSCKRRRFVISDISCCHAYGTYTCITLERGKKIHAVYARRLLNRVPMRSCARAHVRTAEHAYVKQPICTCVIATFQLFDDISSPPARNSVLILSCNILRKKENMP